MRLILQLQKRDNNGGGYFLFHIPIKDFKKISIEPDRHYLLNLRKVDSNHSYNATLKLKEKMIREYPYHFFHVPSRLCRKLELEVDQYYVVEIKEIKGFDKPKKLDQKKLDTSNVGGASPLRKS